MHLAVDSQRLGADGAFTLTDPSLLLPERVETKPLLASLTVEHLIWVSLIVLACLTRFWDLGHKALHHDESLHAYYSWVWAEGGRYEHDPLMHGPLLFFVNAFVFLVFHDSDSTARYASAFFGVLMVASPWFLRKPQFLGRWGAIATAALLLISPTILYQSRYIRHDIYTIVGVMMMFICIVRFLDDHERKWLITLGVTTAMMLANHEIIVANIVIFAGFLYAALIIERLRAWYPERRDLVISVIALHVFAFLALAALVLLMPHKYVDRFLDIPWDRRGAESLPPTRANQNAYYKDLLTNWLIVGIVLVGVAFVLGMIYLMRSYKKSSPEGEGWLDSAAEHSVGSGLKAMEKDSRGIIITILCFVFVFTFLFTSIFTNWYGLMSSTIATDGTFLYWLGQHDVQRGEQPWFYFLVMLPQYEFLPITIGSGLALLTCWRGLRSLWGGHSAGPNFMFRMFLAVWFFGIFAVLSWAGEKMPWLIVHIALPGTILAGIVVGRLIERGVARYEASNLTWTDAAIYAGMVAAVVGWFLLSARLTFGNFNGACAPTANANNGCRQVTESDQNIWWVLVIPPLIFLAFLGFGLLRRGWRATAIVGLAAAITILALLEVRVGWRLSYRNPDIPVEMMVYTQTAPDVKQGVEEANQITRTLQADGDGEVLFDTSQLAWPYWWYLRNNPEAQSFAGPTIPQDTNAAVIFIYASSGDSPENAAVLANYTGVEHPFRWHFPEETYRFFALAPELNPGRSAWLDADQPHGPFAILKSMAESTAVLFTAEGQQEMFRMVVYRDLNDTLGYFSYKIYVRNDLLPLFAEIRY
jgi:predicted membrane-bound mannosyltransferase